MLSNHLSSHPTGKIRYPIYYQGLVQLQMGAASQGTFQINFRTILPSSNYSQMVGIMMLKQRLAMSIILILRMVSSSHLLVLIKLRREWAAKFILKIQIKTISYMLAILPLVYKLGWLVPITSVNCFL